jgi:hypothetical protein
MKFVLVISLLFSSINSTLTIKKDDLIDYSTQNFSAYIDYLMPFSNVWRNEGVASPVDNFSVAFEADARVEAEIFARRQRQSDHLTKQVYFMVKKNRGLEDWRAICLLD